MEVKYNATVLNYDRLAKSDPYLFYTFEGKAPSNDPVGYIPYFQQLIQQKNDVCLFIKKNVFTGPRRQVEFHFQTTSASGKQVDPLY